jgi:raffinose/stachyose/melibiose transport system substrate-binding protein
MFEKRTLKVAALGLSCLLAFSTAGCAAKTSSSTDTTSTAATSSAAASSAAPTAAKVTINLFSDLPDRTTGQGLLEQTIINSYEAANPNVTIKVESLQDDPYKEKFKAYTTANNLPDMFMVWGQPSFFQPVMQQGFAAKLNASDYTADNFLKGSLDGFSLNGNLYGLPRNSDFMALYYNAKILSDNGLSAPTSTSDIVTIAKKLASKNIAAIAIGGKEKWPLAVLYNDIVVKNTGSDAVIRAAFTNKSFSDPALLKAATDLQALAKAGIFQKSMTTDDTGTAKNEFIQGKSAMMYSGEWDMSMASDTTESADFRSNLKVEPFPTTPGGTGKITDILAWNGGGYALSAKSTNLAAATAFLNYLMTPDQWSKLGWQQGLVVPAQQFSNFLTGKENTVQTSLVTILNGATSTSGTTVNDSGSASFKTDFETASQELCTGIMTPAQFVAAASASVNKS